MSWKIERLILGPIQCNCYILSDSTSRKAYIVDPGAESREISGYLKNHRLEVSAVLITHGHIDHVGGLEMFLHDNPGVRVYAHPADQYLYSNIAVQAALFGAQPADLQARQPTVTPLPLSEGQDFPFSNGSLSVIHTPGHSPGSVCFLAKGEEQLLFSGDTLFQASIGRTDLMGGSFDQIIESIRGKLMTLDDAIRVLPGHGEDSTIGIERDSNPFILGY